MSADLIARLVILLASIAILWGEYRFWHHAEQVPAVVLEKVRFKMDDPSDMAMDREEVTTSLRLKIVLDERTSDGREGIVSSARNVWEAAERGDVITVSALRHRQFWMIWSPMMRYGRSSETAYRRVALASLFVAASLVFAGAKWL